MAKSFFNLHNLACCRYIGTTIAYLIA